MTYTQFAIEEESKPRAATGFKGIAVVEEPAQPFFTAIVKEALNRLNTMPHGKLLLDAIAAASPADGRGYNVLIYRVSISYEMAVNAPPRPRGGRSFAKPAHQRLGVGSDAASIKGEGVSAIVGWCQNQVMYTPKVGDNAGITQFLPPALTLGHELIHALHALKGKNKSGHSVMINGKSTPEEEAYTVGLGIYANKKYTENNLRKDIGLPRRESYP
jgi:hypothetical protein